MTEELEKEAEEHCNEVMCTVCENKTCTEKIKCREWRDRCAGYYCSAEPKEKRIAELEKENAVAKNLIEELASSLSVVGECDEEECELIDKAQKFIKKPIF